MTQNHQPSAAEATPNITLHAAKRYVEAGLSVIPIPLKEKAPRIRNWQELKIGSSDVDRYFNGESLNIGIHLGQPSGGLVDIDLDCPEAVELAERFLPTTSMVFGRTSRPRSHWIYNCPDIEKGKKFQAPDGTTILEIRSKGQQTIFPPSVHPSGENIRFNPSRPPGMIPKAIMISADVLRLKVCCLASAALLVQSWPQKGGRHDAALALAGALAQLGWSEDEIVRFILAVVETTGDEEMVDRKTAVRDTLTKYRKNETVTGWPTLAKLIDTKIVECARKWLGASDESSFIPFPIQELPSPIAAFIQEEAAALVCDESAIALMLLGSLASAIGNRWQIRIRDGWYEPCILWVMLVAVTGAKKTPIIRAATQFLHERHRDLHEKYQRQLAEYKTALSNFESLPKDSKQIQNKPEKPKYLHVYADDTTIEGLAAMLELTPQGIALLKDELANWLKSFNAYKSGGGDEQAYLPLYNALPLKIDRKNPEQPTIYVQRASVSIIGGIQPSVLRDAFTPDRYANGLASRFLFTFPSEKGGPAWSDAKVNPATRQAVADIFTSLYRMEMANGNPNCMNLSDDATALYADFANGLKTERLAMGGSPLAGAWSKFEAIPGRLALILQLVANIIANPSDSFHRGDVAEQTMRRALTITRWLMNETRRIYQMLGQQNKSPEDHQQRHQQGLLNLIGEMDGRATVRVLRQRLRKYRADPRLAEADLQRLVDEGKGHWAFPSPGTAGGRPSKAFVMGNDPPSPANKVNVYKTLLDNGMSGVSVS
jgi:hypothetical protein